MTDAVDTPAETRPAWLPWLMRGAIVANVFAVVMVNFWIYYARAAFIAAHPGYVAIQPPTISRAISDPAIGEAFAFWVTLSAIALIPGVFGVALAHGRIARALPPSDRITARLLTLFAAALFCSQAAASTGIYLLSTFRFPQHNDMHMTGSYMFFVAQGLVIVFFVLIGLTLLRSKTALVLLTEQGQAVPRWVRFRSWAGGLSIVLTLVYMGLFQIKTWDFGTASDVVYAVYVLLEPMVITGFLLVLALAQTDLWALARNRSRS